jgi:cell division protein FtsQ
MWDNHQALNQVADWLFALAGLTAIYLVVQWTIHLPLLPLKEVSIRSNSGSGELKHVTREQVSDAVHREVGGNFLTIDLEAARGTFEKLAWVRVASVRRIWPNGLDVVVEEHVPLAHWGDSALVNRQGEIFNATSDEPMPIFEGPRESVREMVHQHAVFTRLLQPLKQDVEQMELSPRRAWRVRLGNGTILELGREHLEKRLERYVQTHGLVAARLNQPLSYVDLRYVSGFAARGAR